MNLEKVKSYIGFSIKSRQIVYGTDDILKLKKTKLIVVSNLLGESSLKKLKNLAQNNNISFTELSGEQFLQIIQNDKIKAFAILDDNLADAINKNLTSV